MRFFRRGIPRLRRPVLAAALAIGLMLPAHSLAQVTLPTAAPAATTVPPPTGAPTPAASSVPAPGVILTLPRDLTLWGMFLAADIVVKAVMVGLVFASVLTWTVWFAKIIELVLARRGLRRAIDALANARSLAESVARLNKEENGALALIRAAETELRLSADALDPAGVKERIASRLERIEAEAGRHMNRGTGLLATIGATAPFVGLFGTVWGIMNSFIGISKQHTTNLAVVAPGIAEALLATALGLVAAIPAVVLYNMFARWIAAYRMLYAEAAAEVLRLVSRDLDRATLGQSSPARRRAAE